MLTGPFALGKEAIEMIWIVRLAAWISLAMIAYVLWKFGTGQHLTTMEQQLLNEIH